LGPQKTREQGMNLPELERQAALTHRPHAPPEAEVELSLLEKIASRVPGIIFKFRMWPDGRSTFPYMSSAVAQMYNGIRPEELLMDASPFFAFRHPDDAQGLADSVLQSAKTLRPWSHEYRLVLPHQGVVWRHGNALPELQSDGSVAWFGFITDITERKRSESQLRISSLVFESSEVAVAVLDQQGRIQAANQAWVKLSGHPLEALLQAPLGQLVQLEDAAVSMSEMLGEVVNHWQGACLGRRRDGTRYTAWLRIRGTVLAEAGLREPVLIAVLSEIAQRRPVEAQFTRQSGQDALTGLTSRRLMMERIRYAIEFASVAHNPLALIYLDLDHFNEINGMFGHPVGDQLLVEVAARLRACAGKTDTVARMGGDEFAVLVQRPSAWQQADAVVARFVTLLTEPFYLGGEELSVTASIGIAHYPKDADNAQDFFICADRSMY